MKNWNNIFSFGGWIGFAASLVFIVFLDRCTDRPASVNTIEKSTIVIYDSTKKEIKATNDPVGISIQTVGIPAHVDTSEILKLFFAIHTYSDQIQDSCIRLQIFDSVCQNKIFGRRTAYQWLKPVKTIESSTITLSKNTNGFYAGGFVQAAKNNFGIGPQITWLTKKDVSINYGFDVINKAHLIGVQFKINARAHD